jgi:hypothetical protein
MVESLTHSPANPTTADTVTITAVVKNQGTTSAGASTLQIPLTGQATTQYSIGALAAGATQTVTRTAGPLSAGTYTLNAWADCNAAVAESNETNNVTVDYFTVVGALDHFDFSAISSPQHSEAPFSITITAKDALGSTVTSYAGTNALTADAAGEVNRFNVEIIPSVTGLFTNGVWTGDVLFHPEIYSVVIHTTGGGASGDSNQFDVLGYIPLTSSAGMADLLTSLDFAGPRFTTRATLAEAAPGIAFRKPDSFVDLFY